MLRSIDAKDAPTVSHQFKDYEPLHILWQGYISDLLRLDGSTAAADTGIQIKLSKADFHGARLSVVRSKCPSLVGAGGIVVKETENTFVMITLADRLITIPKAHSVFLMSAGPLQCTIYGDHFCFRASERVVRKFKSKMTIDL